MDRRTLLQAGAGMAASKDTGFMGDNGGRPVFMVTGAGAGAGAAGAAAGAVAARGHVRDGV